MLDFSSIYLNYHSPYNGSRGKMHYIFFFKTRYFLIEGSIFVVEIFLSF